MNWKSQIFKPQWLHKDPAVRREAVSSDDHPELLKALDEILATDEDAGVRIAAARRVSSPEPLLDALTKETETAAAAAMRERLRVLLCAPATETSARQACLAVVRRCPDRELLEAVAGSAAEPELRSAALARVKRQGFLGDRAINDPDPAIRRQAAAAISQRSTLNRVIAATRTSDKSLHQELSVRLHGEQVTAGEPEAIRQEALDICESLEQLLLAGAATSCDEAVAIERRWASIAGQAPEDLTSRYQRDLARLGGDAQQVEAAAAPEPKPSSEPAESEDPPPEQHPSAAPADHRLAEALEAIERHGNATDAKLSAKRIEALAGNLARAWSGLAEPGEADRQAREAALGRLEALRARLREAEAQRAGQLEEAEALLEQLQRAAEEGALHDALAHRARLQEIGGVLGRDRRWKTIQSQLGSTLGRLRELRDWQHWANDKIRKRLIGEMEVLPATGLHPDAVLERIKALQSEWKALEASEQIPGDKHYAAAPWMWRKFNAAGRKAFEATKPFLDKRSEVQSQRLNELEAVCGRLKELAALETPDWAELRRCMNVARKGLRGLSSVPARARPKTARRLKRSLEKANEAMQGHYAEIEKNKLRLIREAAQLQHAADPAEAIRRAKELQAEWKAAGSLWRSRENALWREFRAPLNPLFEKLDAERQAVREEQAERVEGQRRLCQELAGVLALSDDELADQHGRVQGLHDQWREFRRPERNLQQRFEALLKQYRARERAQRAAAAQQLRQRWRDKADLLHRAESARHGSGLSEALCSKLRADWPAASGSDIDSALDERFRSVTEETGKAQAPEEALEHTTETARKICIYLEFLAGLPSPEQERELRMQYQVERLSASMSGERQRLPAVDEAQQLERQWLCLEWLPDAEHQAFKKRIEKALESIIEE